jgi:hypothetical protein
VFPNVMVVQLAHHTTMAVVEPLAVDRSALITYELASHPARSGGPTAEARRDADFVSQGAAEDRAVAGAVQRGFASGANQVVEFGRFEGAISHFHRQLAGLLEG